MTTAEIIDFAERRRARLARGRHDHGLTWPLVIFVCACFYVLMGWALVNVYPQLVHHWI